MKRQPTSILVISLGLTISLSLLCQSAAADPAFDTAQELALDGAHVPSGAPFGSLRSGVETTRSHDLATPSAVATRSAVASASTSQGPQASSPRPSTAARVSSTSYLHRPPTWSEMNRGFYVAGSLGAHIGSKGGPNGMSALTDIGYQFGFGLGLVAHFNKTFFFGKSYEGEDNPDYVTAGGGLRFSAPIHPLFRLWVQGTYGVVANTAPLGVGRNLTLLGGLDFRLDRVSRTSFLFLGLSGGVEYNVYTSRNRAHETGTPITVALTLSFVI